MKTKWISGMLAVLMICSVFSSIHGTDRFYYGTGGGPECDISSEDDLPFMKDSLKFNIVVGNAHTGSVDSFAAYSIRAMVSNVGDEYSPYRWASQSHYTLWEAEGYTGSNYNLSYNGGTLVSDTSASGEKARRFKGNIGSRLIQWGPSFAQEPGLMQFYRAEFRLKFISALYEPPVTRGADSPPPVCSLMVVDEISHTVLKDTTLYRRDFTGGGYKAFLLSDYNVPEINRIEFQIYLFGTSDAVYFYVDYVKAYDQNGRQLIDLREYDQDIMAYVDSPWVHTTIPETGDTVVYRWYLQDEPWYVDLLEPAWYTDSLLREKSTERFGFQILHNYLDETWIHEYFLRNNPEEYMVDIYPTYYWGLYRSGEDFQAGVDSFAMRLKTCKNQAEDYDKNLWIMAQSHFWGDQVADSLFYCGDNQDIPPFGYGGNWYCDEMVRPLTGNEMRLQTFLALCYGADAILYFRYFSRIYGDQLQLGLYDHIAGTPTEMWYEIAHFSGPRVEQLGPKFHELTWQGAGFHEDVASVTGSFMDSLKPAPEEILSTTYVEVGFFQDDADTNYFMLVNRQCLEGEDQSVIAYLDSAVLDEGKMWYVIDQYSQDTTFTGAIDGEIPFTTHLEPGEGKLFKLSPFSDSAFHVESATAR